VVSGSPGVQEEMVSAEPIRFFAPLTSAVAAAAQNYGLLVRFVGDYCVTTLYNDVQDSDEDDAKRIPA
jgi:hypothetical protein